MTLEELKEIRREADHVIRAAEGWSPKFRRSTTLFKQVTAANDRMETDLKAYFRQLASRVLLKIDWHGYQKALDAKPKAVKGGGAGSGNFNLEMVDGEKYPASEKVDAIDASKITADEGDDSMSFGVDIGFDDNMVDDESATITMAMTPGTMDAVVTGALYGQKDIGIDLGVNDKTDWIHTTTSKHIADKVTGITQTTKDRIAAAIKTSLANGESVTQATSRVNDVVDDPARSEMIARTETVSAWSDGMISYGQEVGAQSKIWYTASGNPCAICEANAAQGWINFDDTFDSGDDGPASHPNCQCSMESSLLSPDDSNSGDGLQGSSVVGGGQGSGNFNHAGRPGEVGGSGGGGDFVSSQVETVGNSLMNYQDGGFQTINGYLRSDQSVTDKLSSDPELEARK